MRIFIQNDTDVFIELNLADLTAFGLYLIYECKPKFACNAEQTSQLLYYKKWQGRFCFIIVNHNQRNIKNFEIEIHTRTLEGLFDTQIFLFSICILARGARDLGVCVLKTSFAFPIT